MYLFGDVETTGFASNVPARDSKQGRVCQVAFILTDNIGRSLAEFSCLIKPDDWTIGKGAEKIHGFTDAHCEKYGIASAGAFNFFKAISKGATTFICHNMKFDWRILEIEAEAHGTVMPKFDEKFCTMLASMDICKLPGNYGNYKWPKLEEALPILCSRELGEDAHDAMIDTKACKDLFFALKERKDQAA